MVVATAVEVAGDIAGWNPHMAEQGDQGVREILANALATENRLIDW